MSKTFQLKKGQLKFGPDNIIIQDTYHRGIYLRILMSVMWTIFGVLSYMRYQKTGDEFLLWSGLIIGGLHFIVLVITLLFFSTKHDISNEEIKNLGVKSIQGVKSLRIRLKNNKTRMVYHVQDPENELESLVKTIL